MKILLKKIDTIIRIYNRFELKLYFPQHRDVTTDEGIALIHEIPTNYTTLYTTIIIFTIQYRNDIISPSYDFIHIFIQLRRNLNFIQCVSASTIENDIPLLKSIQGQTVQFFIVLRDWYIFMSIFF